MSDPKTDAPAPSRTIGWIGTGVMGVSMAGHLLARGHALRVCTRTMEKARPLLEQGARWAETPAHAADGADIVISMVGTPEDVEEVHLGKAGTLRADRLPSIIIDMTTSRPSLAADLASFARQRGVGSLDAPVSGGDLGARQATLSIMVGGDERDFASSLPVLQCMGRIIVHHGPAGSGQHAKMVNQILIASTMLGMCEGLLYARQAGLDPSRVIQSVGAGAAGSWAINNLGPRVIARDFNPGFYVEHFIKDLGIALDEASRLKLALPGVALARQLYEATRAQGHARLGTQALAMTLERLSGLGAA